MQEEFSTQEQARQVVLEKLKDGSNLNEHQIKAYAEALKAIEMHEQTRQEDARLDLEELKQRSEEERAKEEIKSANKRSRRQLAGEVFRGITTVAASVIGVVGSLFYLKTSIEAERDPDDPVILKPWQRNKPKF